MRISALSMNLQSYNTIHKSSNRYNNLLNQASSQMKIQKGSEDPVLAQKAIGLLNSKNGNTQYLKNLDDAKSILDYTETVFGQVGDILGRIKELTLQASSETLDSESREAIAKEMDEIIKELSTIGNQKFNGKYIFAGTKTKTKPFELEGNPASSVKFNGNDSAINYNLMDDSTMKVNTNGGEIFTKIITDVISIRNDISDDNIESIGGDCLSKIEANLETVINNRTELGAKSRIVDNGIARIKSMDLEVEESFSNLMGVDLAKNAVETKGVELSYQASLSIIGKLNSMSLLNYVK